MTKEEIQKRRSVDEALKASVHEARVSQIPQTAYSRAAV